VSRGKILGRHRNIAGIDGGLDLPAPGNLTKEQKCVIAAAGRRKLVKRIALAMKRKPSNTAGNDYLARQMTIQAKAMKRKGMEYGVMKKQLHALEAAVRTELWRLILGRPSPDGDDAA
jgi:hypothetical protein